MVKFVTITSQGQITIPAKFRQALGINKEQKAMISLNKDSITIKPQIDFLSLAGSLHKYAIKGKSIDEIIKLEEEAVGEAMVEHYLKYHKK